MMRLASVILVALVLAELVLLPPRPAALDARPDLPQSVRGIVHVHSRRSDGSGTVDDIAAAAARAGLRFVIFTDHGDATRRPDPAEYRSGVLCIDAVEISTDGGHLVALGLPKAPYPLGGEPRDVVEDVARLGAFSIAAHPGSPKPGLRWVEWTAPFDGLEWLNFDSEWRDESVSTIARTLFTYPVRGAESLALLLDRPDGVLRRWDVLTKRRRVVAVAAADAHARFGTRGVGEGAQGGMSIHVPTYEQVFRTFSITLPQARLTGNAALDARTVLAEIRRGHVYSSIDALAAPAQMAFSATSGTQQATGGDTLAAAGPITVKVQTDAPPDARITLLKDGAVTQTSTGPALEYHAGPDAAVYRVEVKVSHAPGEPPVPWMLSNPIYVGGTDTREPLPQRPPPSHLIEQYGDGAATGWTVEHSPRSAAALDVVRAVGGTQIAFRYGLGGTAAESPYAALVMPAGPALASSDRLRFTARADKPMRVSVQIRTSSGGGERWHRSVYLDTTPRDVSVFFDDVTPVGATRTRRPALETIDSVLWVVDTVNTPPGASGQIWIDNVAYGR